MGIEEKIDEVHEDKDKSSIGTIAIVVFTSLIVGGFVYIAYSICQNQVFREACEDIVTYGGRLY